MPDVKCTISKSAIIDLKQCAIAVIAPFHRRDGLDAHRRTIVDDYDLFLFDLQGFITALAATVFDQSTPN